MKTPIIVNESSKIEAPGDVSLFESVFAAERYLEPEDVENKEYFIFDSEGQRLRPLVEGRSVRLTQSETDPNQAETLRSMLAWLLELAGNQEAWCRNASLSELVQKAFERYKTR